MSSSYAAAMAADRARLDAAKKRSMDTAALHGDEEDAVQGAWDDVLHMGTRRAAESEEEARRRKLQKKSEKRASKKAAEGAAASGLTIYVSGVPPDLSFNAVQNLFGKAGKAARQVTHGGPTLSTVAQPRVRSHTAGPLSPMSPSHGLLRGKTRLA